MTITCPACNKTGTEKDFPYLGNQQSKCNFCGVILENASECPECKSIMIAKQTIVNKIFKLKAVIETLSGNLEVVCRKCGHKDLNKNFKKVYIYKNKYSAAGN